MTRETQVNHYGGWPPSPTKAERATDPDTLPVNYQARSMGVYRVAILSCVDEGNGWWRTRGWVWMNRSKRWTRLQTDHNRAPPRALVHDARADFNQMREEKRSVL